MNTIKFSGWQKGVDNVHQDYEVPADSLRRGVNVDVLDSGKLRRRKGYSLVLAAAQPHSLWSDGATAYFVENNTLRVFNENGTSTALGAVSTGVDKLAYVKVNNDVYFTSRSAKGKIRNSLLSNWGVEVPVTPPVLAVTVGVLPPGTYFAAVTYLTADGRESGASVLSSVTLAADGGVAITGLPIPVSPDVTKKRVYLSTANGEVLYMAAELLAADLFANVSAPVTGAELRTAYLSEPPLGVALATVNGRVFIVDAADPRVVWYTEANDYDHVNRRRGYYMFGDAVTAIASTSNGLFVGAGATTYYISGAGNADASQRVVSDVGMIQGSVSYIPDSADAAWMTEQGPAIGKDGGEVQLLTRERMSPGGMLDTAAMVRDKDGVRQYVVVGSNMDSSALQAGSYAEAEIVRRAA